MSTSALQVFQPVSHGETNSFDATAPGQNTPQLTMVHPPVDKNGEDHRTGEKTTMEVAYHAGENDRAKKGAGAAILQNERKENPPYFLSALPERGAGSVTAENQGQSKKVTSTSTRAGA